MKKKKYDLLKVNSGRRYFFDFPDSGPWGLRGGVLWQKSCHPAGYWLGEFWPEIGPGAPKSARTEKVKKYDLFEVYAGRRYFFDFPGSCPWGLRGGFLWQKSCHPAGCRSGGFWPEIGPGARKSARIAKVKKYDLFKVNTGCAHAKNPPIMTASKSA